MGVLLLTLFTLLVVSGLFLLMYYKPDVNMAFYSVNYTIMHEVDYGWLWRHIHAVAASMVFVIIYIHMFVAIYYGSYKRGREMVWIGGMLLFVVFSAEAFSGYMLPWGQMSYWAATVITNLFGGIPFIGNDVVEWIRGNYIVADATLTRFFMLHVVLLPVVIMLLIAFHFYSLRFPHVNNQDGEEIDFEAEAQKYQEGKKKDAKVIPFWPVFMSKDIFVVCAFMALFFYLVCYHFDFAMDPVNFDPADSLKTPPHIYPEWYFLWSYEVLRMALFFYLVCYHFDFAMDPVNFDPADSLKTPPHIYPEWYFLWSYEVLRGFFFDVGPIKAADIGLVAFGVAQVVFLFLPWLDRSPVVRPAHQRKGYFVWFWSLIVVLIVLTVYGKLPPEGINTYIGFVASIAFLLLIFVALPLITINERKNSSCRGGCNNAGGAK